MGKGTLSRRALLGASSSAAIAVAALRAAPAGAADPRDDVARANGFTVDIPGCAASAPLCVSVVAAPLRSLPVGDAPGSLPARTAPGPLVPGEVRLRFLTPKQGGNADVAAWMAAAAEGIADRRDIAVTLVAQDRSAIRTYTLAECLPVSFDSGDFSTGGEANVAELVVQPTRVLPS